jgi:hypothetical protein
VIRFGKTLNNVSDPCAFATTASSRGPGAAARARACAHALRMGAGESINLVIETRSFALGDGQAIHTCVTRDANHEETP